jgi:hypothetical protein
MGRQRVTSKWLLLITVVLVICSIASFRSLNTEAANPLLSIQVCRANVGPCQNEVSIPEGGTVELDLVLTTGPNASNSPLQVAGWATHFQISDNSVAELRPDIVSGRPVREQGDPELALESLVKLQDSGSESSGQFFTVQNHFDATSGRLDYSVTLVRFDQTRPQSRVLPFSTDAQLHLGRITINGVSKGSSDISPEAISGNPFQVVTLDSSGGLSSVAAVPSSTPQATIRVGDVTTAELQGHIVPQGTVNDPLPGQFPTVLTVTFWQSGAIPPWRGGADRPLATFTRVATDATGTFRITDIAPSLLPPGIYDLRVASRRTLTSLAQGVTIPASGSPTSSPPVVSISISSLRDGDIDGINSVDQTDLDALKSSFGRLNSESVFNTNADFNGDSAVDVLDFTRLAQNFGSSGD